MQGRTNGVSGNAENAREGRRQWRGRSPLAVVAVVVVVVVVAELRVTEGKNEPRERRYKKEKKSERERESERERHAKGWNWIELYGTLIRELGRNWHALTAGKLKYTSATLEGRCVVRGNPAEIPCRDES